MYKHWNYHRNLKEYGLPITMRGDAWAAKYSGFWIQEWKIMLDAGFSSPYSPEHIFITHTHLDHVGKINFILHNINTVPNIYVPPGSKQYIDNYIKAYRQLNRLDQKDTRYPGNIIEVNPGDIIPIRINDRNFEVTVFRTDHTIVSVGFAFSEFTNKLKDEYKSKTGKEIKELKDAGMEITEKKKQELFVYTGDTKNTIFDDSKIIDWNKYKIIMTECTYIKALPSEKDVDTLGEQNGHNILENIEETAKKYPNAHFLLCHWSMRYDKKDIKEHFEKQNYKNISCWVNDGY
jgi:ribonuclease Z